MYLKYANHAEMLQITLYMNGALAVKL